MLSIFFNLYSITTFASNFAMDYGFYILALGGDTTDPAAEGEFSTFDHPFYHGYIHTISAGSFNVNK